MLSRACNRVVGLPHRVSVVCQSSRTFSNDENLPGIPLGGPNPEDLAANVPALLDNLDMKNISIAASGQGGRSSVSGVRATVFGASGQLGRHVVNLLAQMGSQIVLPYRGDGFELKHHKMMGDLGQCVPLPYQTRDKRSIERVIEGSNVVINCIGSFRETRNFSYHDTHVNIPHVLARTSAELGVDRFIHVSTLNADENNDCEYFSSKWHGEQVVKLYYPEATIIRPSMMYGFPPDYFFQPMARHWYKRYFIPSLVGPDQLIQPCHYIDSARAIVKSVIDPINTAGKTYGIYGDVCATKRQFFERVRDCMACSHYKEKKPNYWAWSPRWGLLAKLWYKPIFVKYNAIFDLYRGPHVPWWTLRDYELAVNDFVPDLDDPNLLSLKDLGLKPEDYFYWEAQILEPWHLHGQEELRVKGSDNKNGYGIIAPVSSAKSVNYALIWGFRWSYLQAGGHVNPEFSSDLSEREKWKVGGEGLNDRQTMAV